MAGKSDYLENTILDLVYGGVAYTPPAILYVALFSVAPTDAGGGTELSGGGYARVAVPNDLTNFPAASGGSKSNGTAITFPTATADWATVVAFGIFDAAGGGNLLSWGTISPNKTALTNDTMSFAAGDLTFTED